ncbi:hypothetical protein LINGRAHAP2_LOCUS30265 [Linum grandiflorum]
MEAIERERQLERLTRPTRHRPPEVHNPLRRDGSGHLRRLQQPKGVQVCRQLLLLQVPVFRESQIGL